MENKWSATELLPGLPLVLACARSVLSFYHENYINRPTAKETRFGLGDLKRFLQFDGVSNIGSSATEHFIIQK